MGKDPKKKKKVQNRRKQKPKASPLAGGDHAPNIVRINQAVIPPELKGANLLPIYECLVIKGWDEQENGFAQIVISRRASVFIVHSAVFLVDYYCLGVKDVIVKTNQTLAEYRKHIREIESLNEGEFVKFPVPFAHNFIYSAVEYAREIGFEPNADFEAARCLLDDRNAHINDPFDFEFGFEGRPFYIQGPDDNAASILSKLDRNVGRGKYKFTTADEFFDVGDDVQIDELPDLLDWVEETADDELFDDDDSDDDEEYEEYEEVDDEEETEEVVAETVDNTKA